ncbi:MAG: hypothetical protein B7Y85_11645 [Brevundimonas sp. 32-68-21]|nr:MAG: hypothetical protein B7Y85_11645 [Brevundimonas sp. 32-68-21]
MDVPDRVLDLPLRLFLGVLFQEGQIFVDRFRDDVEIEALERVTGVLNGRQGGFSMVHRGVMNAGSQELLITIVPGSGSGDLAGVSGVFHLTIADGEHRYVLDYSLPE